MHSSYHRKDSLLKKAMLEKIGQKMETISLVLRMSYGRYSKEKIMTDLISSYSFTVVIGKQNPPSASHMGEL